MITDGLSRRLIDVAAQRENAASTDIPAYTLRIESWSESATPS